MLVNMHHLKNHSVVWMLTDTGNNLRYVDLTKIHAELGQLICQSLPGYHAITGCDCNPAFFRKGKLKPYKILKKVPEYQEAFKNFGKSELIENTDEQQNFFNIIYRFICNVYNAGNAIDVDAARLQMFIYSYTVSDVKEAFDRKKLRKFDASNLPPCKSELLQQFLRANYICTIWNNARLKTPTTYQPANNGWILENNKYHFKWFEGDQLPSYVSDSLKTQSAIAIDETLYLTYTGLNCCCVVLATEDFECVWLDVKTIKTVWLLGTIPLEYEKDVTVHGIKTLRFGMASNTFATGEENPYNKCYCEGSSCRSGIMPMNCKKGAPYVISMPHFLEADQELVNAVEGVHPNPEKHKTYVDVEPTTGFVLNAAFRVQLNGVARRLKEFR
ncbi:platelet glycoprotein 4 [Trichonephila clavata]|uniref:Platelet glycoprotein 4 n=1 Tax=Trichonephila clavata TaxID=2740835 RepID=A0A8X6LQP1_TRICU|nr:platelet glycoprotein 4 [Trichonephila clavata]